MSSPADFDKIMQLKAEAEKMRQLLSPEEVEREEREANRELSGQIYAHGCICPPGAERTCQGPLCPRQKWIVT